MATATPTPLSLKDQMAANSAAWKTATPQMQTQLHQQNLALAGQQGQTYNAAQGTYSTPTPAPTPVKTATSNVPLISNRPDTVNGGNLTEYRTPIPTDTGIGGGGGFPAVLQKPAMPQVAQQAVNPMSTPAPTPMSSNGIDRNALQAEAASRIAKLRAGVEGAVTAGKASRTNLFDLTNKNTQGTRAIQNFDNSNRGDQFGGSAREDKFRLQREQGIQDTFTNNAYTNDINTLDNQLTSFDSMAPEQQQTLYNDLLRQERDYGLQEGALTGNLNGQRTLAGSAQDYVQNPNNPNNVGQVLQNQGQAQQNLLNQYKIDNYPAESKAAAQQVQQQLQSGQLNIDTAKFKLDELKDPNSPTNQAAKLDLQMKQLDAKNYPRESQMKLEQLQKQINQIGAAPYKSADEKAYEAQRVIEIKANIDKIKAETSKAQTPKPNAAVSVKDSADNHATITTDLAGAKDAAEANALIEANKGNLTDADYKDLKKKVIDQF